MLKTIALVLLVAPAAARADKAFVTQAKATWDCKKDPVVTITHGHGTYTFKGDCKSITLTGGENTLTIESSDAVSIQGGHNTIAIGTADTITILGADNTVTYKKAKSGDKPTVSSTGANNKVDAAPADDKKK